MIPLRIIRIFQLKNSQTIKRHSGYQTPPVSVRIHAKIKFTDSFENILFLYTFVIYNLQTMKNVSLKIDDSIFRETEKILSRIKKPRNRYINEAIAYYNRIQKRLILEKKLKKESELLKEDSMNILKEFEQTDYAD